jgi:hypothetical protein
MVFGLWALVFVHKTNVKALTKIKDLRPKFEDQAGAA